MNEERERRAGTLTFRRGDYIRKSGRKAWEGWIAGISIRDFRFIRIFVNPPTAKGKRSKSVHTHTFRIDSPEIDRIRIVTDPDGLPGERPPGLFDDEP